MKTIHHVLYRSGNTSELLKFCVLCIAVILPVVSFSSLSSTENIPVNARIHVFLDECQQHATTGENVRERVQRAMKLYADKTKNFEHISVDFERAIIEARRCLLMNTMKYTGYQFYPLPEGQEYRDLAIIYFNKALPYLNDQRTGEKLESELQRFHIPGLSRSERDRIEIAGKTYNVYWGDIHGHSTLSDGVLSPYYYYSFARRVAKLDFCALTDHAFRLEDQETVWQYIQSLNNQLYEPGAFVTFHALEWSGRYGHGHHNYYFRDDEVPGSALGWQDEESGTINQLWDALVGYKVLTIPHHTSYTHNTGPSGIDWRFRNDELERLVEIYSIHGTSEYYQNPKPVDIQHPQRTVQKALERGYRFGFIGSGDSHNGHPGSGEHSIRSYRTGLAAVYAPELTRKSIFDALQNRFCYATDGERIFLDVRLQGAHMGQEIVLSPSAELEFSITIKGSDRLQRIEVITAGGHARTIFTSREPEAHIQYRLPSAQKRHNTDFPSSEYFYVRVTQANGSRAWSSPIWIDYRYQK